MLKFLLSAQEEKMFINLGFVDILNLKVSGYSVTALYKGATEKCFVEKMEGPYVESLRRCLKALQESTPVRHSDEFDALIRGELK